VKRLLYQIHRWVGIALALFMSIWFLSGLVIMYAGPSALGRAEQLAGAERLRSEAGWLSAGEAWTRSSTQRHTGPTAGSSASGDTTIAEARLVRQGDIPRWLVEDTTGRRYALSAVDGHLAPISLNVAAAVVQR